MANQQPDSRSVLTHTFMRMRGTLVECKLRNGSLMIGLLDGIKIVDNGLLVKIKLSHDSRISLSTKDLGTIEIRATHLLQIRACNVVSQSDAVQVSGFHTDGEITRSRSSKTEGTHQLQKWTSQFGETEMLEEELGNIADYDQFTENRERFGVVSTFDENIYTSHLNKDSEFYKQNQGNADRVAHQIMSQDSSNIHVKDDRNGLIDMKVSEEDMYSTVQAPAPTDMFAVDSINSGSVASPRHQNGRALSSDSLLTNQSLQSETAPGLNPNAIEFMPSSSSSTGQPSTIQNTSFQQNMGMVPNQPIYPMNNFAPMMSPEYPGAQFNPNMVPQQMGVQGYLPTQPQMMQVPGGQVPVQMMMQPQMMQFHGTPQMMVPTVRAGPPNMFVQTQLDQTLQQPMMNVQMMQQPPMQIQMPMQPQMMQQQPPLTMQTNGIHHMR
eukprot:25814_1